MTRALVILAALAATAHAEPQYAVGAAAGAYDGADGRWEFFPELVGERLIPLTDRLVLRPGARVWALGLAQPEAPRRLAVREHDVALAGELGLVRTGALRPALVVGAAASLHVIRLAAGDSIDVMDRAIDRTELVPSVYAQAAFGVPLHRAGAVVEPYLRYEHAFGDDRFPLRWGLELTIPIH